MGLEPPVIVDSFMFNNELDMLECRLVEIADAVDYLVAVEADVDHQGNRKPYVLSENLDRFDQWKDKLIVVRATGLPTAQDAPDPWAREHAQREYVTGALERMDLSSDDVILHGDIDEIPTAVAARNVRPRGGFVSLTQRGHFWSLRWLYPPGWQGTMAGRVGDIRSFAAMRDLRNMTPKRLPEHTPPPPITSAAFGWHLSWLPNGDLSSAESAVRKVGSYCHPEVTDRINAGLASERFLADGVHVDGVQMTRCEVDHTFPKWIREGHCPESWLL
jgi:hypothetical protein